MFRSILISLTFILASGALVAQETIPIAEAKKQEFGSTVGRVAGRVTASTQFRNTAYVQDAQRWHRPFSTRSS